MATFVLIHGAWQAAWCWRHIVPLLDARGHRALTLDLPGHGADPTPLRDVTLPRYVDAIVGLIEPLNEHVILVGHSMGALISSVAESFPDAVAALVYVAGAIPTNGSPMMQVVEHYDPAFPASFVWATDGRVAGITPEGARQFLYHLCPASDVDLAIPLLTPEPVAPFETPMTTTQERFDRVPRYYIETLRDRAVPPPLQKSIQARVGFRRIFALDTDHSPFFSAPGELASCLDAIAADL